MKTKTEPSEMTLMQIMERFPDDDKARAHLEKIRWQNGIVCPHCECADQSKFSPIAANLKTKVRAGLRYCSACGKQFTCTVGTIFEDSHIPLRKWVIAWYLLCASKKGISALQVQRMLDLGSYRTAWMMMHKIRYALQDPSFSKKLTGTVEVDETFIGGERKGRGRGYRGNKTAVVALVQRGGDVRSQVVERVSGPSLQKAVRDHVEEGATVMSDDYRGYRGVATTHKHYAINHSGKQYVKREKGVLITTNTVEGYFSLLKRGVVGTFHHVSKKHLPLYLAEFNHRYNNRKVTDGQRTFESLSKMEGKRLTYRQPV
jgi:transposase-like protein